MKQALKWIGFGLGALVSLLLVASVIFYFLGNARLNERYEIQVETIAIPTDEAAVTRGRHLAESLTFCQGCHGENLEGDVFDDEPGIASIYAPNLTSGKGGIGSIYSDDNYVSSIRHGINQQGRGQLIMHSDVYHNLSEQDLGAIVAYLKSVPPVDNDLPETRVEPLGKVLVALGVFDTEALPLIPAELIDHDEPFTEAPAQDATAEYGQYLVSITLCRMCHGSNLTGAPSLEPGTMPDGPNVTPAGELDSWSQADFMQLMRTGVTPHGETLDPDFMPWNYYTNVTDKELEAIWLYLNTLDK